MTDINEAKRALIAHYEREREELNVLIARLRRDLGVSADAPSGGVSQDNGASSAVQAGSVTDVVKPGDFFGMTQVQAVRTFLERTKQPASLQDIAMALYRGKVTDKLIEGTGPLRNLSSILSRAGDFVSIARGRWGLADWYPNRAIKRARKGKDAPAETDAENGGER